MSPKHVLIVEDSLTAGTALRLALLGEGISDATLVASIEAAKDHLRERDCDLVVLDLLLPDASGLDGLRAIRELAPEVAIVILTGTDDRALAMQALKEGAQDYLIKGEVGTMLLRTLSYAMQRNQTLQTIEAMSKQLHAANEELVRANELKDQFVGMVAHDLRSPLGVILGMSRLLRKRADDRLDARELDLLERIGRASGDMLRLVDDLLDLSSIESGALRLVPREIDVSALVSAHLAMSRELASQKHIEIEFHDATHPVTAILDPQRYEQVLDNLIGNAIKYSHPKTAVVVRLELESDAFVTTVRDRGQGIPEDEQTKLFLPFARTSATPTGGEKSTGLGLTIVRKIVEGHGGTIGVESKVGEGSSFAVRLPLRACG